VLHQAPAWSLDTAQASGGLRHLEAHPVGIDSHDCTRFGAVANPRPSRPGRVEAMTMVGFGMFGVTCLQPSKTSRAHAAEANAV